MTRTWRLTPFVLALALIASQLLVMHALAGEPRYGDVIGPVTPTSMGVRLPTTRAEFERLTPAERARIEAALYARLPQWQALVDAGLVQLKRVSAPVASSASRGSVLAAPLATSAWGQCRIEWQDVFGGSWMRGYALTRADATMSYISVGLSFLRDGSTVGGPNGAVGSGISNVEQPSPPSSWIWKGAFEQYNWTTSSSHTAQGYDNLYYVGPGAPCNISMTY